jgi:HK97 family phage major capsid protein
MVSASEFEPEKGARTMSDRVISELTTEMRSTLEMLQRSDQERIRKLEGKADKSEMQRISADMAGKVSLLQGAIDSISRKLGRPAGGAVDAGAQTLRENARGLCEAKHFNSVTKGGSSIAFNPSEDELIEAETACLAFKRLFRTTSPTQLTHLETKALSNFSMGASGFICPPEMSSRILSCLIMPTDVTGLMSFAQIAGPSIKFLVDEVVAQAAWVCDTSCFANNPTLVPQLGEMEIKCETARFTACTTSDVLEDAAINIETWLLTKVSNGFRVLISGAVMTGDGIGKPLGILNPAAGIPICDTSANTPAGAITWQDLIALKYQVNLIYHPNGVYLCNQDTFGLLLTLSDALGRPIMIAMPTDPAVWYINGSPVKIVSQMPSCVPGATPILFGDLQQTYMIANRKSIAMQHDPYSAGYCHLFKFEARVGGGVICPNASRLQRVK